MKNGPQRCRGPDFVGAFVMPDPLVQGVALSDPCPGPGEGEEVVAMGVQQHRPERECLHFTDCGGRVRPQFVALPRAGRLGRPPL